MGLILKKETEKLVNFKKCVKFKCKKWVSIDSLIANSHGLFGK